MSALAFADRGTAFGALGEHAKAAADFTRSLELMPDHAPALRNRGQAYHALKETDKAHADFAAALKLEPSVTEGIPSEYLAK